MNSQSEICRPNSDVTRVLLVEDNPADARLLREALREDGAAKFSLTHVKRLDEALEGLNGGHVDIILLDLSLPDEHGLKPVMRTHAAAPDVPIVVLTGLNDEELALNAVRNGAQDYLVKGQMDSNLLVRSMRYAIERQRAEEALHKAYTELEIRVRERTEELTKANEALRSEITERKRAEKELKESEDRYRQLYDEAPIGYHEIDRNGTIVRVNRTEADMLGYTVAEMIGRPISDFVIPEQRELAKKAIKEKIQRIRPLVGIERKYVCKDGRWIDVYITERLIFDEEGRVTGIRSTMQDITERKLMASQLLQAQKLESIGQLAAGIAHEINTPIQYVGDNTLFLQEAFDSLDAILNKYEKLLVELKRGVIPLDLLAKTEAENREADIEYFRQEIPKAIQQSLDGIGRIAEIVRAMKEFSHPGSEKKTPIDMNHAIENTIIVARNEWKYVADVVTNFDSNLPPVHCLPGEFSQVILNIIVNAAHAIADIVGDGRNDKGTITVRTRCDGDWAEIRISDTGAGIPEAVRHKIFTPFFTTKEVGKGTGQGLAIARSVVVKKHGGTITFETEVGKGTTFIIRLPINGTQGA